MYGTVTTNMRFVCNSNNIMCNAGGYVASGYGERHANIVTVVEAIASIYCY